MLFAQVLKPCGSFEALIAMAGKMPCTKIEQAVARTRYKSESPEQSLCPRTDEQLKSKFNLETQGLT